METNRQTGHALLSVENIGGIDETEVTFSPGVTILAGRNATNRTSLLQAIMAVCGSDEASIKGDADTASVELTIDGDTYTRKLSRAGTSTRTEGKAYLEDTTLADLFAFLLDSNEARQVVAQSGDLRNLIMRPIDTAEIEAEIDRLVAERKNLEEQIDEIDSLKGKLPKLESERTNLQEQFEKKQHELAEKEAKLESLNYDQDDSNTKNELLEDKLETLRVKRSKREDVRFELETERESLDMLRTERRELAADLDDISDTPADEISEIDSKLERLRSEKRAIEAEIKEIKSTINFNETALEGTGHDVIDQLSIPKSDGNGAVTDQLVTDESVICWTCGSSVNKNQIELTLTQLQELNKQKVGRANDLSSQIEDLQQRRKSLNEQRQKRQRLERRLDSIETDISESEQQLEDLQSHRDEVSTEIETLDAEVESMEDEEYSEVLSVHKEANQLEYELGRLESELERVKENISSIDARIADLGGLKEERKIIQTEIEELRTKIDRTERDAIEAFNAHMEQVLDRLHYDRLARIWLERVQREVREGNRKLTNSVFELHIVRQTDAGTTYEDTIDHLSESEREVVGLIFGLAGYLVHDVHEHVPFVLLDSLEAIDAERISELVEYFSEYCPYLIIALLEDDAAYLSDRFDRVTEI